MTDFLVAIGCLVFGVVFIMRSIDKRESNKWYY